MNLLPDGLIPGDAISADPLVVAQWVGLAVLTVALLILMGTRWGQAKPLSKCIALSVFAHILFITYAYGTKLILDHPGKRPETVIRLASIAVEGADDPPEPERPQDREPWSEFPTETTSPVTESVERQVLPPTAEPTKWQLPEVEFSPQVSVTHVPTAEPARPVAELTATAQPQRAAVPGDAQPEIAEVTPADEPAPSSPAAVPLVRRPIAQSSAPDARTESVPTPKVLLDPSAQLQRLADLPAGGSTSDAAEGDRDEPRAADNLLPEALAPGTAVKTTEPAPARAVVSTPEGREPQQVTDDRQQVEMAGDLRSGDSSRLPELYSLRASVDRPRLLQRYGGSRQTEESVAAALAWLAANQHADGRWDADHFGAGRETRVLGHDRRRAGSEADTGITGLALLALLGSGDSHLAGIYRANVQRGLEYLMRVQAADGNLAGEASLYARMYCHGIATLAMSEAMALTGDQRLEPYVTRAIHYTVEAQHPVTGGWRYQPGDPGDMSQFGWQVMALKSAELAGIQIPGKTRGGMLRFLNDVSSGTYNGLASYRRGERVSPVMTAEALACRYFLGRQGDIGAIREAAEFVSDRPPTAGKADLYYWYYGTLALFQAQGPEWESWNRSLQRQLLARQRGDGGLAGSWDPDTMWGGYGGRVYSTAMATLCLEVYYRYLPVYELARR